MNPSANSNEWSYADIKMFEAALAATDLFENNWLENLAAGVPTKTLDQVRDHVMDLVLDGGQDTGASTEINIMENNYTCINGYGANFNIPQVQEHNPELGYVFTENDIVLPSTEPQMQMPMRFGGLDDDLIRSPAHQAVNYQAMNMMFGGRDDDLIRSPAHQAVNYQAMNMMFRGMDDDLIRSPAHQAVNYQAMNKQPAADAQVALNAPPENGASDPQEKPTKAPGWTEHEHRRFLIGLTIYGKGDWRTIARDFVRTKTPTQVASHAQKFLIRHEQPTTRRRKPSIHDIRSITAPITFGSPTRSIYDMIDWDAITARYNARVSNSGTANNGASDPFFQLKNGCLPTASTNGKASSAPTEINVGLQAESFEEPAGLGSCNDIGTDGMGVDDMDDETWAVSYLLRSPDMSPMY